MHPRDNTIKLYLHILLVMKFLWHILGEYVKIAVLTISGFLTFVSYSEKKFLFYSYREVHVFNY